MHTNRNSDYTSSYNTQPAAIRRTLELVNAKPTFQAIVVQASNARQVTACASKASNSSFDFAGLAG